MVKKKRSILEIASVPTKEQTKEERKRLKEFDGKLDDLLKEVEALVEKVKEKNDN